MTRESKILNDARRTTEEALAARAREQQQLPQLLTAHEAAAVLRVSEKHLWSHSSPRGPIPCIRLGRVVRYHRDDIDEFIADQRAASRRRLTPAATTVNSESGG